MATFERVIPLLVYQDIPAAYDFLVKAFGFEPGFIHRDGDGNAVHGEVKVGEVTIWMHRVTEEHKLGSPRTLGVGSEGLVVHVDDVDAHFRRARAALTRRFE